jgi:hypothetical protein
LSSNGTTTAVAPPPAIELLDRVARYRTALLALVEMVKREGGWRSADDQMLIREVERLLGEPSR